MLGKSRILEKIAQQADASPRLTAAATFVNLTKVFVNDFIRVTNDSSIAHLPHFLRAMLTGIHLVFPHQSAQDITGRILSHRKS